MNKLRNDSVFSQLTPEQVETLEGWLFEENLGYKEALERVQNEFKVQGSLSGLRRFYRRLAMGRNREDLLEMVSACAEALKEAKTDGSLQAGLLTLANKVAVELLVQSPGKVREFTALLRAITSAQALEMKRVEFQRGEDKRKEWELKEQREREWALEITRERIKMNQVSVAKRKATIAAKKAAAEAARLQEQGREGEMTNSAMTNDQGAVEKGPMPDDQGPNRKADEAPVVNEKAGQADGASILTLPESASAQLKKLSPEEAALRGGCFRIIGDGKPRNAA